MSIYHLSVKIVSRKHDRSVVDAAAYRSGSALHDEAAGITHDYRRKPGVEHTEIVAPPVAPEWVYDRQRLWNAVERMERRKDAQLAREIEIALPIELDDAEQVELVRHYVTAEFVAEGMIADIAIHRENRQNPHTHILLSTRNITPEGFGLKEAAWSDLDNILRWRQQWAELANAYLAKRGNAARIDYRSLAAQGIDRPPGRKRGNFSAVIPQAVEIDRQAYVERIKA